MFKKKLALYFEVYKRVTTCVVFAVAVYTAVFWGDGVSFSPWIFWQVILIAAITSLGSVFLSDEGNISKRRAWAESIAYFAYVNVSVMVLGYFFGWYYFNWPMVISMEVIISAIYVTVSFLSYCSDCRTADKLNEGLKKYQRDHEK
ncbi:DUF3021 family protein [Ligilactobacillus ruminis]|uniref:DUF3021 family protein n=1 Tax=Ligilactobacillus ruminis TaxID=1623 RepID=UPI0009BBE017|nr:DUF3021 family protein [Ligilactobacillus ruminis]MDD5957970.1 DUF3021 family protein [Ligilactobacillus ruminis]NME32973.1 DUF3021 domain-containing protein [Ligilactobacillus ruminis]WDC80271.1 DUF3021 family protein [Ligilactobacillus ruminis]WKB70954.1 DUF3021 family protein [Ligilactobacillus ruminis]